MPPLVPGPSPDQPARAPLPASRATHPFLVELRAAIADDPQAVCVTLLELLGPSIADSIDEALAESHPSAACGLAPARLESEPEESDWLRFWDTYPNKVNQDEARAAFDRLPWDDQFRQEYFEGYDRALLSRDFLRGFAPAPANWIKKRRWEDEPLGLDGKKVKGDAQRRREQMEHLRRAPIIRPTLQALSKSLPKPAADQRGLLEMYADDLRAGKPRHYPTEQALSTLDLRGLADLLASLGLRSMPDNNQGRKNAG
jgi:hypothetical protein